MKKLLKVLLGVVVLVVGAFLAIGFLASTRVDERSTYTIDAPPAKVWAVISSPERTTEWMPAPSDKERIVKVTRPGALEAISRAGEQAAKTGDVNVQSFTRHTYVKANGVETTVEVAESVPMKKIREHVVADTSPMAKMFPDISWGFEMSEADGGAKTTLTPFMVGEGSRPFGAVMYAIMSWTGAGKSFRDQIAQGVEKAAKAPPPAAK